MYIQAVDAAVDVQYMDITICSFYAYSLTHRIHIPPSTTQSLLLWACT